jgi:hypothetical protein
MKTKISVFVSDITTQSKVELEDFVKSKSQQDIVIIGLRKCWEKFYMHKNLPNISLNKS